jgi:hypothetical protein
MKKLAGYPEFSDGLSDAGNRLAGNVRAALDNRAP